MVVCERLLAVGHWPLVFGRLEVDRDLKSEFVFDDDDVNSKSKTF